MRFATFFCTPIYILFLVSLLLGNNHPRVLINSDSVQNIYAKVYNDSVYPFTHDLYQFFKTKTNTWANKPVTTYKIKYTQFSDVAFVALVENDSTLKDRMIQKALQFDKDFSTDLEDKDYFFRGWGVWWFNATFYTIATALIYDYCYDRLTILEKDTLINNVLYGLNFLKPTVFNTNDSIYYYGSHHSNTDAAYLIGGMAIYDDSLSNGQVAYSYSQLDTAIETIKINLFDEDYGLYKYMWGDNGVQLDGAGYFAINFGRQFLCLQAFSHFESTDYFNIPVVKESLGKSIKWLCSALLPNRVTWEYMFNALNVSGFDINSIYTNLLVIAQKYHDGKARWLFDEGIGTISNLNRDGNITHPEVFIPSIILYKDYPSEAPQVEDFETFLDKKRGLLYWRTGWNSNDLMFSIESTPVHHKDEIVIRKSQSDKGSITLTAYGNSLIKDTGGSPNSDSAAIHDKTDGNNYININGDGEAYHGQNGFYFNDGRLDNLEDYNFLACVKTFNKSSYDTLWGRLPDTLLIHDAGYPPDPPRYVNPVQYATREVFYIKENSNLPFYFWVLDEIQKSNETAIYDWHICTDMNNSIDSSSNPITVGNYQASLDVFLIHPNRNNIQVQVDTIPPLYPSALRTQAKRLILLQNSINGNYNVILVPYPNTQYQRSYSTISMTQGEGGVISWNSGYEDYFFFSEDSTIQSSTINSNANTIFIRKNTASQKWKNYFIQSGSFLTFDSTEMINLNGQRGKVICDSQTVKVFGSGITRMKIYAPYATQFEINDNPSPYYRVNDYIYFGPILSNEDWSGTVELFGDVTVGANVTLTIASGTTIKFSQGTKITVCGYASFEGTVNDSIYIESMDGQVGYGIEIPAGETQYSCFIGFEYCSVNNLSLGVGALKESISVYNSTIKNCVKGISIVNAFGNIYNNNINFCGYGIYVENSTPTINTNDISYCNFGIFIISGSGYYLNNQITKCGYEEIPISGGFYASESSSPFLENEEIPALNLVTNNIGYFGMSASDYTNIFAGSNEEIVPANVFMENNTYEIRAKEASTIYAINNYWGENGPDPERFDIGEESKIIYEPWLEDPPLESISYSFNILSDKIDYKPIDDHNPKQPLENLGWESLFITLFKSKKYSTLINQGKSLLSNLTSVKDINFLLSLVHHSSIVLNDSVYSSFLQSYLNNTTNQEVKTIISKFLIQNYLKQNMVKQAKTLIGKILSLKPSPSLESFMLLKDFQISLFYERDINSAVKKLALLKNKYPNHEYTELAKMELNSEYCNKGSLLNKSNKYLNLSRLEKPVRFNLSQNYPNPFNPSTTINFSIPERCSVKIKIFNILGQKIKNLVEKILEPGDYLVHWDGKNSEGNLSSSGIYIYVIETHAFNNNKVYHDVKKMILLR